MCTAWQCRYQLPVVLNNFEERIATTYIRARFSAKRKNDQGLTGENEIMEIYNFDKSLQERLTEYKNILSISGKIVPASMIKSEWVCDVDVVIEPVGWQALWNMSLEECEKFGLCYPTVVMVEVLSVDCPTLSALVKIVAVQDDIHLSEKHKVRLIQLYPTIKQQNTSLDIAGTANCIDQVRFFYHHLWMPWDHDDDETVDWVEQHLESRIRFIYDMKRGAIDKDTCDRIKSLMKEAREAEKKISKLEETIPDEEEMQDDMTNETCQLMKLYFRLEQIKSEIEMLENPRIRELFMKNQSLINERKSSKDEKSIGYLVWLEGTAKDLQAACNKIEATVPKDLTIRVCGCLDEALRAAKTGDTILLGEGPHPIKNVSGLEEGGTIRGIYNRECTIVSPRELGSASALLDFSGTVLLENICIDVGELQIGLIARKGTIRINDCRIRVSKQTSVKLGIVVMPGVKLIIERSVFENLGTAAIVYETGELIMRDCSFRSCLNGVQLCDNARFIATECFLQDFMECAIRMETEKYITRKDSLEGLELLYDIPEISLTNCKFLNNYRDAQLKAKGILALTGQQDAML